MAYRRGNSTSGQRYREKADEDTTDANKVLANLDKDIEKKLIQHIMQYKKDKIIIMVTYYTHLLDYADVVYQCNSLI